MAFFSGRRHLRSKALVMAAAANNHSQPQVFRFVKMRNPPKSLKIFHLCRKPMQNEVPQFGDTIFAAPRKLGCCSYYQVFIRPKQCSEMPSLGQNKKESSCDNKQLYNWGKNLRGVNLYIDVYWKSFFQVSELARSLSSPPKEWNSLTRYCSSTILMGQPSCN